MPGEAGTAEIQTRKPIERHAEPHGARLEPVFEAIRTHLYHVPWQGSSCQALRAKGRPHTLSCRRWGAWHATPPPCLCGHIVCPPSATSPVYSHIWSCRRRDIHAPSSRAAPFTSTLASSPPSGRIRSRVVGATKWVEPVEGLLRSPAPKTPTPPPTALPSAGGITLTDDGEKSVKYRLWGTTNWRALVRKGFSRSPPPRGYVQSQPGPRVLATRPRAEIT